MLDIKETPATWKTGLLSKLSKKVTYHKLQKLERHPTNISHKQGFQQNQYVIRE